MYFGRYFDPQVQHRFVQRTKRFFKRIKIETINVPLEDQHHTTLITTATGSSSCSAAVDIFEEIYEDNADEKEKEADFDD